MDACVKRCFKCGDVKELSAFHKHSRMKDGHLNKCAVCTSKDSKAWKASRNLAHVSGQMTRDELMAVAEYDPETGLFTSKVAMGRTPAGAILGHITKQSGYRYMQIAGKRDLAHRLAWLYAHGVYPKHEIDHINRNRADNRIVNLRAATSAENRQNMPIAANNTSGCTGVSFDKRVQKFHAYIKVNKSPRKHIGYFNSFDEAVAARLAAKAELHKFHGQQSVARLPY